MTIDPTRQALEASMMQDPLGLSGASRAAIQTIEQHERWAQLAGLDPVSEAIRVIADPLGLSGASRAAIQAIEQHERLARLAGPDPVSEAIRVIANAGAGFAQLTAYMGLSPADLATTQILEHLRDATFAFPTPIAESLQEHLARAAAAAQLALGDPSSFHAELRFLASQRPVADLAATILHDPTLERLRDMEVRMQELYPEPAALPPRPSLPRQAAPCFDEDDPGAQDPHLGTRAVSRLNALTTAVRHLEEAIAACDDASSIEELETLKRNVVDALETLFGVSRRTARDIDEGNV